MAFVSAKLDILQALQVVCVFLSHICHTFGKDSAYFGFEKFAKAEDGPSEKDGAAAGQELSAVHK